MATIALHITRYSLMAQTLLQRYPSVVGTVHSCYDRIVNIETPDQRLLTLQGPGLIQAPGALCLDTPLKNTSDAMAPGDTVVLGDEYPARVQLLITETEVWDGRLRPVPGLIWSARRVAIRKLSEWLLQHATDKGLVPLLTALDTFDPQALTLLLREFYRPLVDLMSTMGLTGDAFLNLAREVVGLGDGLTPSGDDLIVGLMAALHVTDQAATIVESQTARALLDSCRHQTTDLSTEFVRCAIEGHFSEPLVNLMSALYSPRDVDWGEHAERLVQVGHSSGVDAMVGVILGHQLLARRLSY